MSGKKTIVCEECAGTGAIEDDECPFCLGEGRIEVDEDETWEKSEDFAEIDEYGDILEEMDEEEDVV